MVTHDQTEAMSISDRVVVMQAGRVTQVDAPYRLYEEPQTRFISSFVGKANLLSGRISGTGATARVDLGGAKVDIDGAGLSLGRDVSLSLRPEKIRFVPAGQGQLDGVVTARFFLGSQWLYHLDTPAGPLVVACPNADTAPLEERAGTGLAWAPRSLRVLPEGDGAMGSTEAPG
jgi:putative spermidine/putrescine transport system ATP-binding protein